MSARARGPRRPAGREEAGFTLLETIVVVAIMGLALTVVAGFLPRRNTALDLSGATSQIAGAMRLARARAIAEQRRIPFAVTRDGHGFRTDTAEAVLPGAVSLALTGQPEIVFEPDGSASGGTVRVRAGERVRTILVEWLTGRVTVAEAS